MPYGTWVNELPMGFFMLVHLTAFAIGVYFAYRSFEWTRGMLGAGFLLFALAEVIYMTYHLDWTIFLFAHTVAEVLDLAAFALVFVGAASTVQLRANGRVQARA
jgi:hypothetical protein